MHRPRLGARKWYQGHVGTEGLRALVDEVSRGRHVGVRDRSGTDHGGRRRLGRLALFLEADLLLDRAAQLVGRLLELLDALAQRTAQFRQLSRSEDNQGDHEYDN